MRPAHGAAGLPRVQIRTHAFWRPARPRPLPHRPRKSPPTAVLETLGHLALDPLHRAWAEVEVDALDGRCVAIL